MILTEVNGDRRKDRIVYICEEEYVDLMACTCFSDEKNKRLHQIT